MQVFRLSALPDQWTPAHGKWISAECICGDAPEQAAVAAAGAEAGAVPEDTEMHHFTMKG